jgi:hypothetical protein
MAKKHAPKHAPRKRRYDLADNDAALIVEALTVHKATCERFARQTGQDFQQLIEQLERVAGELQKQRGKRHQ